MENNNNFNQPQPQNQSPQQSGTPQQQSFPPPHQPIQPPREPVGLPPLPPENNGGDAKKWLGWLSLVVLIIVILYFANGWGWLSGLLITSEGPGSEEGLKTEVTADVSGQLEESDAAVNQPKPAADTEAGKGRISVVVSSFLPGGVTLSTGVADPNIEIRKVYLRNPVKDSWLLVYDGSRPLDLNLLNATGEKHELIATSLAALAYDKIRLEFADLVKIDQRGSQKIAQLRTVDLDLTRPIVRENEQTAINISFNISKPDQPQPTVTVN